MRASSIRSRVSRRPRSVIAGPQDKKNTLDEYYGNFDGAMPEQAEWIARFERTRDFIRTLLNPEEIRAWNGKSDFYTLFLAMAPLAERVPKLTATEKDAVRSYLAAFRASVDQAKRKDNKRQFPRDVHDYAEAVTRAATGRCAPHNADVLRSYREFSCDRLKPSLVGGATAEYPWNPRQDLRLDEVERVARVEDISQFLSGHSHQSPSQPAPFE